MLIQDALRVQRAGTMLHSSCAPATAGPAASLDIAPQAAVHRIIALRSRRLQWIPRCCCRKTLSSALHGWENLGRAHRQAVSLQTHFQSSHYFSVTDVRRPFHFERNTILQALSRPLSFAYTSLDAAGAPSLQLLTALLQQVQEPPAQLFASVDDTPAAPGAADVQAASAWVSCAAGQLQLAAEIAAGIGARELGLEALALQAAEQPQSAAAPSSAGGRGVFIIEELDADAATSSDQPSADLPVAAVLAASLFGADSRLGRPWAAEQPAAAAALLLRTLGAKLADWQQQEQRRQEPDVLLQETVAPARAGSQQPAPEVQQLVALTAPAAAARLRPVLAANVEHGRHRTARLEPYTGAAAAARRRRLFAACFACIAAAKPLQQAAHAALRPFAPAPTHHRHHVCAACPPPRRNAPCAGPGNFERCVAAGQLAWLARQLSGRHLSAAAPAVLPSVLAGVEDPFPPAQACCLWALQHLAAEGQAGDFRSEGCAEARGLAKITPACVGRCATLLTCGPAWRQTCVPPLPADCIASRLPPGTVPLLACTRSCAVNAPTYVITGTHMHAHNFPVRAGRMLEQRWMRPRPWRRAAATPIGLPPRRRPSR